MRAKVTVLGAPPRFQALLERFLTKVCRVRVVAAEQAEVCIIDLDGYGAGDLLAAERRRQPRRPLILLSLQEIDEKDAVCLRKPLQSRDLALALQRVLERREQPVPQPPEVGSRRPKPRPVSQKRAAPSDRVAFYDPEDYLQALLATACRQALTTDMTLRLDLGWEPIVIYPRWRVVWMEADDRKLQAFCRLPLRRMGRLTGDDGPRTVIRPDPEAALREPPPSSQRMDALLWKVAWWNSDGRFPKSVAPDRPVQLKHWPNLTRYWHPPQALPVAALLYRTPQAPLAAARLLELPVADVAGFISAALALGLLRFPDEGVAAPAPAVDPAVTSERQGLFRWILKRLRGG